jgi:hypothetical protein
VCVTTVTGRITRYLIPHFYRRCKGIAICAQADDLTGQRARYCGRVRFDVPATFICVEYTLH